MKTFKKNLSLLNSRITTVYYLQCKTLIYDPLPWQQTGFFSCSDANFLPFKSIQDFSCPLHETVHINHHYTQTITQPTEDLSNHWTMLSSELLPCGYLVQGVIIFASKIWCGADLEGKIQKRKQDVLAKQLFSRLFKQFSFKVTRSAILMYAVLVSSNTPNKTNKPQTNKQKDRK